MGINDKRVWIALAILWGFGEATFFFIVPDVALTAGVLVFGLAFAMRLAGCAAIAAMLGGLLMYAFAACDPAGASGFVAAVPLVGEDLLARAAEEMSGAWPVNLALGAVTGAPYKLYAVAAGSAEISPVAFAAVSLIARFLRFALAISIAVAGFSIARRLGLGRFCGAGLAFVWAAIYAFYIALRLSV